MRDLFSVWTAVRGWFCPLPKHRVPSEGKECSNERQLLAQAQRDERNRDNKELHPGAEQRLFSWPHW